MLNPTLCIDGPAGGIAGIYGVSVAWQGPISMANSNISDCGAGTGKYGAGDEFRRVLRITTYIDPNI